MADLTQFDLGSSRRIARVVRHVERQRPPAKPLVFDPVGVGSGPGRKVFRVCTFTGAWAIGSAKTVTFKNQTATPNTVSVTNLVVGLSPPGECDVSVARDGTAWYLVQPNLTQQPGYAANGTQVMTIVNGSLRWFSVSTCSTATSSP